MGQKIPVFGEWFELYFTENSGMAFGIEFGGEYGKLFLTLFRIFAVFVIAILIAQLSKKKASVGIIFGLSLILAGAIGNIIDSIFYGVYFTNSRHNELASFVTDGTGYGRYCYGRVVDMLHFRLIEGFWPDWVPFFGGNRFEFFRPIFNIADSAISTGIFYLLLFQRSFFTNATPKKEAMEESKYTS